MTELPAPSRSRLEEVSARSILDEGDLLFQTTGTDGRVHIVMEGRVRLSAFDSRGEETDLAILEPGEAFLEPPHRAVQSARFLAEALSTGELLSLDRDQLVALVESDPEVFAILGEALG